MRLSTTDLEILRLVEAHRQTQAAIAETLGISPHRVVNTLHKARKKGLVHGYREGLRVDWAQIEGQKDEIDAAGCNTSAIQGNTAAGCNTSAIRCNTAGAEIFTPAEVAALKMLAHRELSRIPAERSGETQMVSGRLDSGLVAMLKESAEGQGLSLTEALNRCIEVYLSGR